MSITVQGTIKLSTDLSDTSSKLKQLQNSLNNLKLPGNITSSLSESFSTVDKKIESIQRKMEAGFTTKSDIKSVDKDYDELGKLLKGIQSTLSDIGRNDLAKTVKETNEEYKKLQERINNVKKAQDDLRNYATAQAKTASSFLTSNGGKDTKANQAAKLAAEEMDVKKLTLAIAELEKAKSKLANADTSERGNQYTNAINEFKTILATLSNSQTGIEALDNALKQVSSDLDEIVNKNTDKLAEELKETSTNLDNMHKAVKQNGQAFKEAGEEAGELAKQTEDLKNRVKYFFSLTNAVNLFKRAIQSAFNTVKELDAAMTETAVVTDFSVGDMWEQLPEYTKRANELGVSIKSVYDSMTLFYQQGLTTNEATALSNATLKMARIASLDAAEATDRMTNALRGFNMELNEKSAQRVADVYSELAAVTASDVNEISVAMTKTASIAHAAGMSFENTSAFLSQIIETTRESAETAGTAMKTIIARFTEVKKLASEGTLSGTDEEGEIIDVNKIQTALRTVGISMTDFLQGNEGLDSILMQLAEKWGSLDVMTQRYIATQAAGSRQQSRFIALMQDYNRTVELTAAAEGASGAATRQYEKTLESLNSKLAKLKNAWDQFIMGLANNEVIKVVVDLLTGIINAINKLTTTGVDGIDFFLKLATAIGAFKLGSKIFNSFIGSVATTFMEAGGIGGAKFKEGLELSLAQKIENWHPLENLKTKFKDFFTGGSIAEIEKETAELFSSMDEQVNELSKNLDKANELRDKLSTSSANAYQDSIDAHIYGVSDSGQSAKEADAQYAKINKEYEKSIEDATAAQNAFNASQTITDSLKKASIAQQEVYNAAIKSGLTPQQAALFLNKEDAVLTKEQLVEKVLETGAIDKDTAASILNNATKKKGLITKAKEISYSIITRLGLLEERREIIAKTVAEKGENAALQDLNKTQLMSLGIIGLIILAIIAVIALIVLVIKYIKNNTVEARLEKVNSQIKELNTGLDSTKENIEALEEGMAFINDIPKKFEGLVQGTAEWNKALAESNSKILELIRQFPSLKLKVDKKGILSVDEKSLEDVNAKLADSTVAQTTALMSKQLEENELYEEQLDAGSRSSFLSHVGTGDTIQSPTEVITKLITEKGYNNNTTEQEFKKMFKEVYIDVNGEDAYNMLWSDRGGVDAYLPDFQEIMKENYYTLIEEAAQLTKQDNSYGAIEKRILSGIIGQISPNVKQQEFVDQDYIEKLAIGKYNDYSARLKEVEDSITLDDKQLKNFYSEATGMGLEEINSKIENKELSMQTIRELYASESLNKDILKDLDLIAEKMEGLSKKANGENTARWVERFINLSNPYGGELTSGDVTELEGIKNSIKDYEELSDEEKQDRLNEEISNRTGEIFDLETLGLTINSFEANLDTASALLFNAKEELSSRGIKLSKDFDSYSADDLLKVSNKLKDVFNQSELGKVGVDQILKSYSALEEKVPEKLKDNFRKIILSMDWSDINSLPEINKALKEMGIVLPLDDLERFYGDLKEIGYATEKIDTGKIVQAVDSVAKIKNELSYGEQDRKFDEEQYKAIISAVPSLAEDFVLGLDDKYTYVGNSINDLILALDDNTKALLGKGLDNFDSKIELSKDLNTKVANGEIGDVYKLQTSEESFESDIKDILKSIIGKFDYEKLKNAGLQFLTTGAVENMDSIDALAAYEWLKEISNTEGIKTEKRSFENSIDMKTYLSSNSAENAMKLVGEFSDYKKLINPSNGETLTDEKREEISEYKNDLDLLSGALRAQAVEWGVTDQEIAKFNNALDIVNGTVEATDEEIEEAIGTIQKYTSEFSTTINLNLANEQFKKQEEQIIELLNDYEDLEDKESKLEQVKKMGDIFGIQVDEDNYKRVRGLMLSLVQGSDDAYYSLMKLSAKTYGVNIEFTGSGNLKSVLMDDTAQVKAWADEMIRAGSWVLETVKTDNKQKYIGQIYAVTDTFGNITGYDTITEETNLEGTFTILRPRNAGEIKTVANRSGGGSGYTPKGKSSSGSNKNKKKKWENPYDQYYNLQEKYDEQLRRRELLEEKYNMILEDRFSTYQELRNNILGQVAALRKELDLQQQLAKARKSQLLNVGNETYTNSEGVRKSYSKWGVTKYAKYDQENNVIKIDWSAINKVTNEEKGKAIEDYIKRLEELQKQYEETQKTTLEIEKQLEEIKQQNKDSYLELEERLYDAVVEREQKKIDDYQEVSDQISESNSKILDSMRESIELERQIRDNTKTEEEIADKEQRLAYLKRDTNASQVEIKQLEEEIRNQTQDYSDTLVDQKLDDLADENERAAEQREKQIKIMQEQLDVAKENGLYWPLVYDIINNSMSDEGTMRHNSELVELLKESDAFKGMSEFGMMNWIDELTQNWLKAQEGFTNFKIEEAENRGTLGGKDVFDTNGAILGKNLTYNKSSKKWTDGSGNEYTVGYNNMTGKYTASKVEKGTTVQTAQVASSSTTKEAVKKETTSKSTKYKVVDSKGVTKKTGLQNKTAANDWIENEIKKDGTLSAWQTKYDTISNAIKNYETNVSNRLTATQKKNLLSGLTSYYGTTNFQSSSYEAIYKWAKTEKESTLKNINSRKAMLKNGYSVQAYKTGGINTETGPAWLDGTPSKPEYILNAEQTGWLFELNDILSGWLGAESANTPVGNSYFDININVDKLESDYDVDQVVAKIKKEIYKDGTYRNVNVVNRLR